MSTIRPKRSNQKKAARARSADLPEVSLAPAASTKLPSLDDDLVAERAYQIWMAEGCPDGRALQHWLQARSDLAAS